MATNQRNHIDEKRIKQQAEKVQSQLEILARLLLDIFDKYSILSYKNAILTQISIGHTQKVKDYILIDTMVVLLFTSLLNSK